MEIFGMKLSLIDGLDRLFVKIGDWASVLFIFVVVIGFFEVVMRYVFNSPTIWVHETTTFIVSITLLYGGVSCFAENKHIRMEFIRERFSKKTQWFLELLVNLLMLLFFSMLTYGSYCTSLDAFISPFGKFKMQTSGTFLDTPFPALNKGFFLLTCIVIFLLCIAHIFRHLAKRDAFVNEKKSKLTDGRSGNLVNGGGRHA